jgi:hypothetical protein
MTMFLKACRRCNGDLVRDQFDDSGRTLVCIQCGAETPALQLVAPHPAQAFERGAQRRAA